MFVQVFSTIIFTTYLCILDVNNSYLYPKYFSINTFFYENSANVVYTVRDACKHQLNYNAFS